MIKIPKKRKSVIYGILFILFITAFSYIKLHRFEFGIAYVISSDARGYFQYLPAIFIHHDVFEQSYGYLMEDGRFFNKYNYGVALMQLPFFLVAFVINLFLKLPIYSRFSPYAFMAIVSAAFYVWWGMVLMYKLLRKFYTRKVLIVTIGSIFLGTNLLYYTYFSPGHSHVYTFFLISCFISLSTKYFRDPNLKTSLLIAIVIGILVLIRISHVMVLIYLPLYQISRSKDLLKNFKFLITKRAYLFLIPMSIVIFYVPQMYYWHELTGNYFVNPYTYSYVQEGFIYWANPQFLTVLFGPTGGWLIVSPILILSIVGVFLMYKDKIGSPIAVGIILLLTTYIYSSWWLPTLAGSYGHRGFVDIYPFLIFPFAYVVDKIYSKSNKRMNYALHTFLIFFIFINIRYGNFFNSSWFYVDYGWAGFWQSMLKVFFIGNGFH